MPRHPSPRSFVQPTPPSSPHNPWRMSVAPMMDWTDRHCRHLH
ncbi:MAG TPA: tRNA dihydrouridine(20/20a) synthase DusA, partial [Alicycliphilus sp.]|nr:tRNA dihydrouridine(20/20a) synthase DusA [Alicycliphilus sp.]